jgi:TonB family protein
MIGLHDSIANFSAWWWPRLFDHLWQATIFGVVVLIVALLLKRGPASLRHSLWLLASAKFLIPAAFLASLLTKLGFEPLWLKPAPETSSLLYSLATPATSLANNVVVTVSATSGSHSEIYCGLTALWIAGVAVLLSSWCLGLSKWHRLLRSINATQKGREWLALQHAKKILGWRRDVGLVLAQQPVEPGVFRIFKPVIVLPDSIAKHLDDDELLAIMLHELVHIERRDNLSGKLQLAVTALFWFHPLVWFVSRKLFDEREQACDERVLQTFANPETYAASILKVVRFSFGWKLAGVTGAGSGSNLRRRIENIMSMGTEKRSVGIVAKLLTSAALVIALVAIVVGGTQPRNNNSSAIDKSERADLSSNQSTIPVSQVQSKVPQDQVNPPPPPAPAQPPSPEQPANPAQPPAPANIPQPAPDDHNPPAQPANPAQPPPVEPGAPIGNPAPPEKPAKPQDKSAKKGKLIEAPRPIYPEEAKAKKVEGQVSVEIVIGEDGNVISARPVSGPELLQGAAKDAAMKARFEPTVVEGKPAKVTGTMTYKFVLDEKSS